jgi:hypothetical protein
LAVARDKLIEQGKLSLSDKAFSILVDHIAQVMGTPPPADCPEPGSPVGEA